MVRELRSTYLGAAKPVCSKAACMAVKTPNAATKTQCSQKKDKIVVLEVKFECLLKIQAENSHGHSLIPEPAVWRKGLGSCSGTA